MLWFIMGGKIQKSRQNIQQYLSSNQPQQKQPIPPIPNPTRSITTQPSTFQSTPIINTNVSKVKLTKNQLDIKLINIAGKQYTKDGMVFRFSKEDGKFQLLFQQDGVKTKLQGKKQSLSGKRVKPNYTEGSCTFQIKHAFFKKQDPKESANKGAQIWINGKQVNQQNATIWLKDKDQLKPFVQSSFMEGLIDATCITCPDQNKIPQTPAVATDQGAQTQQDHSNIKLTLPTPAQQGQVEKIRKIIKQMKEEDKITILMQIFKIKKEYDDPLTIKKLKCPIHFCDKSYKDVQQLKTHLKQKHPQLSRHGIQLSQYDGTFQYGSKAMDLALFIGKMYPQEMKKIIKQMKAKLIQ